VWSEENKDGGAETVGAVGRCLAGGTKKKKLESRGTGPLQK
jgi:hypothetical protein